MCDKWSRFLIFIMLCYWSLTFGHTIVGGLGYLRLMKEDQSNSHRLLNSGNLQIVQKCGKQPCIVRYRFSCYYSWYYIKKLCFLLLIASLILALGVKRVLCRVTDPRKRGISILLLFVAATLVPLIVIGNFHILSATIVAGSFCFGALFWWIDTTFIESENFYKTLKLIVAMGDSGVSRIDILFRSKNTSLLVVYGLFTLFTVSLGLAISQIFIKHYEVHSVCSLHIFYLVFLISLGSAGLLGKVGAELGRQIHEITKALGNIKQV